jgi:hypothetical protein
MTSGESNDNNAVEVDEVRFVVLLRFGQWERNREVICWCWGLSYLSIIGWVAF